MQKKFSQNQVVGVLVWLLVVYLAWDFARPHDIFTPLKSLRVSLILTIMLAFPILQRIIENKVIHEKLVIRVLLLFALCCFSLLWVYNQGYWRGCFKGAAFIILIDFIGVIVLADNKTRFLLIVRSLIVFHVIAATYGIINGGRGPGNFLGDENDLALALNSILPVAYFLSLDKTSGGLTRWFFILSAAILLLGVVATNSRGGFLALAAIVGTCFIMTEAKRYFIYAVLVFAIVVGPFVTDRYIEEMATITNTQESTADGRLWSWKLALDMYKDNPVLGIGMCNYRNRVAEYEVLGIGGKWGEVRSSLAGRVSHSIYFTIIPELGTVGVVLFILIVYQYYVVLTSDKKQYLACESLDLVRRGLIAGMVGYLISGAFLTAFYTYPQFWLLCGLAVSLKRLKENSKENKKNKNSNFTLMQSS